MIVRRALKNPLNLWKEVPRKEILQVKHQWNNYNQLSIKHQKNKLNKNKKHQKNKLSKN